MGADCSGHGFTSAVSIVWGLTARDTGSHQLLAMYGGLRLCTTPTNVSKSRPTGYSWHCTNARESRPAGYWPVRTAALSLRSTCSTHARTHAYRPHVIPRFEKTTKLQLRLPLYTPYRPESRPLFCYPDTHAPAARGCILAAAGNALHIHDWNPARSLLGRTHIITVHTHAGQHTRTTQTITLFTRLVQTRPATRALRHRR